MPRLLFLLLFLFSLGSSAQTMLKRPLQYVPADSVFVLPKGEKNIIMDIMAVAPFAEPHPIVVTKESRRAMKKVLAAPEAKMAFNERLAAAQQLLLLTGQSSYADFLSHNYFDVLPRAIEDDGILPREVREESAQQILDLVGCIVATDGRRDVYVNIFENCVCRVRTSKFRLLLDIVSSYPEQPVVKFRIEGLEPNYVRFALHIRVPSNPAPDKFFLDGHEIIRPVIRDGYLVIDREWRNGEEVFFQI